MRPIAGRIADVEGYISRLAAGGPEAFLVIEVGAPDAVLQLKATGEGFELDHPLVTPGQRGREGSFRTFCEGLGLRLKDVAASNGARFLDCYLSRDIAAAAASVREALAELFGVDATTALRFSGFGLAQVAA
jgi:hypothetical protein